MTNYDTFYKDENGEYRVVFTSDDREKAKAVEKVCRAVIDGEVETEDDVEPVRYAAIERDGSRCSCSNCDALLTNAQYYRYCPNVAEDSSRRKNETD